MTALEKLEKLDAWRARSFDRWRRRTARIARFLLWLWK